MKINVWLVYDTVRAAKNTDYIDMHYQLAKEFGMQLKLVIDTEAEELLLRGERPDVCFMRTIRPLLSRRLEEYGICVLNSAFVSEICNDKGKTIQYVKENTSVPIIPTKRYAREQLSPELLLQNRDFVIKSVDGHGGGQVFLTSEPYERLEKGIGTSDFVLQPFIVGEGKDIRVYVIGNQIIGAVERTATKGFKSNFSLGGHVRPYRIDRKLCGYVQDICKVFSFGMAGIDFLVNDAGDMLLNEIEDVVGARMFYECYPQSNILREYFTYVNDVATIPDVVYNKNDCYPIWCD